MTREEAKEILTHNWTRVDNPNYTESELDEAFFMAIEALSAETVSRFRHDMEIKELKHQIKDQSADAVPQLKQTDTLIIADALRYLAKDTERHLVDRTRADALRQQFLKYGASMCKGGAE